MDGEEMICVTIAMFALAGILTALAEKGHLIAGIVFVSAFFALSLLFKFGFELLIKRMFYGDE